MKYSNIRSLLSNSMFVRLMLCFLLIILISSTFYFIAYNFFISNIEQEIINNASYSIDYKADKLDEKLYQIKNVLLKLISEKEFSSIISGQQTHYVQKQIVDLYKDNYIISSEGVLKYLESIFVLPEDSSKNILTMESTFDSERYFGAFYKNPSYTKDFWLKEMKKEYTFCFYPTGIFLDYSNYNSKNPLSHTLMPLALKGDNNSSFIIVALIDVNTLYHSIDKKDNFYIFNYENELIYPLEQDTDFSNENIFIDAQYKKTNNGYLFSRRSGEDKLIYTTFLSNAALKQQLRKTNTIFRLIAIISILLGIVLSIYIVKVFNDPVKQITEIIKHSMNKPAGSEVLGLKNIRDSIQLIVKDSEAKSSMLQTYLYQSRLKGSYSPLNEMKKQFSFSNYILLCFVIHFKDKYKNEFLEETGKGTFILKELIELYLDNYYKDSITFQIESDKIISIININQDMQDLASIIERIADKLKYEEDYVFFTIILSNICSDTSQLHKTYDRLFEMYKYRRLLNTTQILSENIIRTFNNIYYLSSEKIELLNKLLTNAEQNECLEFIRDILQYNLKKGVTQYNIQFLCIEIINCGIKVLTKSYNEVPACFDIASIYTQFNLFTTIEEYNDLCRHFIISVTDYIKNHKKEGDYIIDNITDYIEKHYSEEIYLDLLAKKLGITSNYISTYFKEKVGTNFNYYLNNFRIKKAIELFNNPSFKVKDVSEKVGYSSVNTFIRIFKKHTGKTPDEYRKNFIA